VQVFFLPEAQVLQFSITFFTFSNNRLSGTGKSVLLSMIIAELSRKYRTSPDQLAITASTGILLPSVIGFVRNSSNKGIAAINIGGSTLHTWAGIARQDLSQTELAKRIRSRRDVLQRWIAAKTLIIDEGQYISRFSFYFGSFIPLVSMLDGQLFDKLEALAKLLRNNQKPFGGIQVTAFCKIT
jgi:ATP-dependent DNA helicase PIF1